MANEKICGIYKITSPSNKVYIGQSVDCNKRMLCYRSLNCKSQHFIYHSLRKYGWERHTFEIIHICSKEELNKLEKYYIDLFQSSVFTNGMNIACGGVKYSEVGKIKKLLPTIVPDFNLKVFESRWYKRMFIKEIKKGVIEFRKQHPSIKLRCYWKEREGINILRIK